MHCVIEQKTYLESAEAAGLSPEERHRIVKMVSDNPDAGDIIKGTGGARKIRFPFRNKGKSGGVRVITYYAGDDIPVFLLEVFAKGDRIDLTQAERNQFRKNLATMAESYREKNNAKIADMMEKVG